ncbi:MAG TPA: ATP-binding protein [Gemmatimonadaceae bacterium]|nr:ATP-binding protein [Gemmatimonadaceae bacterium]
MYSTAAPRHRPDPGPSVVVDDPAATAQRFRSLIESSTDAISIVDADGIVRYASPAHTRTLGIDAAELERCDAFARLHPDDDAQGRDLLAQLLRTPGGMRQAELRFQHRDGTWRTFVVTGRSLVDDPAVRGVVLTASDVTEQRELERRLFQRQKLEAVGRLAGGIAHDLNNILTVVTSYCGVLRAELPAGSPLAQDVREIDAAAARAATLTQQLLAFGRRQVGEARVVDLNRVVQEMQGMLRRIIGEDVVLDVVLAAAPVLVTADPAHLEQVVMNLVVNARHAMPDGGRLAIHVGRVEYGREGTRRAASADPGGYALLRVRDTGTGMDELTRARAFEPFFTTRAAGQGSGLGLATVYGIVDQAGGYVALDSAVGRGTTVTILLPPAREPAAEADEPAPGPTPPAGGSETVLLVEDQPPVRQVAQRLLERQGYTVLPAASGDDALALVQRHDGPIHLLLTDVVMPRMSGRVLAERLRERRAGVRVLFMSGYATDVLDADGLLQAGAQLLPKPFTPESLGRAVRAALGGATALGAMPAGGEAR